MKATLAGILAALTALIASGTIYPQILIVKQSSEESMILVSGAGVEYSYAATKDTRSDYLPGDIVAVIMFNAATPDDVTDDEIMALRHSGFFWRSSTDEITLLSNNAEAVKGVQDKRLSVSSGIYALWLRPDIPILC